MPYSVAGAAAAVVVVLFTSLHGVVRVRSSPQVPCFFIFGDSLVDNGNNNAILTLARANYMPYGVDFPAGVTGRFTNGRTTVDVLAQLLGFSDLIPPYAATRGPDLLRGVNFASGAAGIRDETGNNLGDHMPMNRQVENLGRVVEEARRLFRGNRTRASEYLSKCIFFVGMGSNDYLNNYFMPTLYTTSIQYTPSTFSALLLQDYSRQLARLYNLGARKIVVSGVGQIGCIPYEIARINGDEMCNQTINKAISIFNAGLVKMVDGFNKGGLPGSTFVFLNAYQTSKDLARRAASYGFTVIDRGCCGVGRNNGQITCLPLQSPCENRGEYFFWDAFHPTEAVNLILGNRAYSSKLCSDAYPMNIQQLASLR